MGYWIIERPDGLGYQRVLSEAEADALLDDGEHDGWTKAFVNNGPSA